VRLGDDPESVHDARVAARRLRSDLRTYAAMLDADAAGSLREELGWIARSLGGVRDADVLEARIRADARRLPDADRPAGERLVRRLCREREEARAALLRDLSSARYVELLKRVVSMAKDPSLTELASHPARQELPAAIDGPWSRLAAAVDGVDGDRGADGDDPDVALHAVRIRTKRVRYAAESMIPCYGGAARRFARAATELQDILGEHHDAVVGARWLRSAAEHAGPRTAFVAGELAAAHERRAARGRRRWRGAWMTLSRKSARFWT
jgi:CHAD domain-containing protein